MLPDRPSRLRLIPILAGQAIGLGCGLAGIRLNSHLVPPAALGVYGVFLTFAPIGMWVVHAGPVKFAARHWAAAASRPALLRALLGAWARRVPWLWGGAAVAALAFVSLPPTQQLGAGLALAVAAPALALATLAQTTLQAERAHWRDCAVTAAGALSRTLLPPFAYLLAGGALGALWGGFAVHAVVFAAAGAWALRRDWRLPPAPTAAPKISSVYEGPMFLLLAGATWILSGLNRWLVAWRFGGIEAGYFTLAGGAAIIVPTMLGTVLLQYHQPGFFALGDAGPSAHRPLAARVERAAALYTVAGLVVVAAIYLAVPSLVGPLIGPAYRPSLHWFLSAGCFAVATTTGVFFHTLLLAGRRETACAPVDLATAAVLVLGGLGAALAGAAWFERWLYVTPVVPWLVGRPLARHFLFNPAAAGAPAPAR